MEEQMTMPTALHEQAAKVFEVTNKLVQEVARLRADIARLHSRIEPFEGEIKASEIKWPDQRFKNFAEAFEELAKARLDIQSCEYHLSAIRGLVDNIASDGISREEMKPWLKAPK